MNRLQFVVPVRLSRGPGHPIKEIEGVAEAIAFLREWPTGRRGPVFNCAMNCCLAADGGQISTDDARRSFAGFIRISGMLVDERIGHYVVDHSHERPMRRSA